jgi:hypothetical protein
MKAKERIEFTVNGRIGRLSIGMVSRALTKPFTDWRQFQSASVRPLASAESLESREERM